MASKAGILLTSPFLPRVKATLQLPKQFIAQFIDSSKATKEYINWLDVAKFVSKNIFPVVLLAKRKISVENFSGIINLTGKTKIEEIFEVVYRSAGVISNDSLGAHIGLGYDKPLVVFFCSTSNINQFFSSKRILIFEPRYLTCWPCSKGGLRSCPTGMNDCRKYEINLHDLLRFFEHEIPGTPQHG